MTMRKLMLITGVCGLAAACNGGGDPTDTTVGTGTGSASIGSASDTEPTPTEPTPTDPDPDTSASAGTPGTMGETSDTTPPSTVTDGETTVDPSDTTTMNPDTTDTGDDAIVAIEIDPLDAIVTVIDGVIPPPTAYTAVGVTADGEEKPVFGSWTYDKIDVATIASATGSFSATGFTGGIGTVTFAANNGLEASTSAAVKLQFTSEPMPVDPGVKDACANATMPDPSMALLYPYDQTVFPRGLTGPTIQWDGGGANDLYYIHAYSDFFDFKSYVNVAQPSRYAFPELPEDIWLKLTASTVGPVKLDIQRFDGVNCYQAKSQTWTIAPANLTGTVYYWAVNQGDVLRLPLGADAPETFIQKPGGVSCVACHSVSKDGQKIVASFNGGSSPWGTFESATGASLYNSGVNSGFEAISPNGSHVLHGTWVDGAFNSTGQLTLSAADNAAPLAYLNPGGGAPAHPAWSGDAAKIAFTVRTDGNGLDFNTSTLWITDVDLMSSSFANTKMIVPNSPPLTTTTFPSFAPDSQWIAFNRSTTARTRSATSEVWLTNLDGSSLIRLDKANGLGIIEPGQDQCSYEPTFMPVSVGGYFWLIIGSERKYGNTLTSTAIGSRPKQLWVTAIDANVQPGVDPSHPAFWLPGQQLNNTNMRGEWALSPCKQIGEGCSAGFDCCDGFCYPPSDGEMPTCNDVPDSCSHLGDACELDSACCNGEGTCIGGFCSIEPG
jgi:hypothetical protein